MTEHLRLGRRRAPARLQRPSARSARRLSSRRRVRRRAERRPRHRALARQTSPSDQYPSLALPPLQASQNPVVFYGADTKKNVQLHMDALQVGAGQSFALKRSTAASSMRAIARKLTRVVTDAPMEFGGLLLQNLRGIPSGTVHWAGWSEARPSRTVKIELASTDPPPLRVNPTPIPGDTSAPGTARHPEVCDLLPQRRTRVSAPLESSQGEGSKTR